MSDLKDFFARWSRRKRAGAAELQPPAVRSPPPCGEGLRVGVIETDTAVAASTTPLPNPPPQQVGPARLAQSSAEPGQARVPWGKEHTESADRLPPHPQRTSDTPFDPSQLPPIESITAESDVSAFLAPGVPAELTRAALRRAWAADPKIRDFVGLAENSWDFNAAGSIPGFGPLEMTEELRRQIAQLMGGEAAGEGKDTSAPPPVKMQEERAAVEESPISNVVETDGSRQSPSSEAKPVRPEAPLSGEAPQHDEIGLPQEDETEQGSPDRSITKRLHGGALPK